MVAMRFDLKCPVYIVDLTAAAVCAAALLGSAWLGLVRGDRMRGHLAELRESIADSRRDLSSIESARDRQKQLLREKQKELADRGHLPEQTPVEEYFQAMSSLAQRAGLSVVRHQPMLPRSYPGLLERRYAYEISGTFASLMQFLRGVEESPYWADVSYLRVEPSDAAGANRSRRSAMLTMSLFSAGPSPTESKLLGT